MSSASLSQVDRPPENLACLSGPAGELQSVACVCIHDRMCMHACTLWWAAMVCTSFAEEIAQHIAQGCHTTHVSMHVHRLRVCVHQRLLSQQATDVRISMSGHMGVGPCASQRAQHALLSWTASNLRLPSSLKTSAHRTPAAAESAGHRRAHQHVGPQGRWPQHLPAC